MPRVPFIGRLFFREYLALFGSFLLIGLEILVRIITLALPQPAIQFFYNRSRSLFNFLSSPQGRKSRTKKKSPLAPLAPFSFAPQADFWVAITALIRDASDFVDLCAIYGYYAEEHIVQTTDGYLLGLHRLPSRRAEDATKVNNGTDEGKKRVVYLHHGLLMNSEVWVCMTEKERCLPFQLVDKGFDVWLGNNRGNKYSKKCAHHSPTSVAFWDFSMDQFAFYDIPDSIAYILSTTGQPSLSYIGFSQGTAQAFATLSIHPKLNEQVNVFIALAPAMSPAGLSNGVVDSLIKASPEVIFLAFGRRSILSSATMWQAILYPPIFVRIIDMGLSFLFNWKCRNISTHQKLAAYPHLYSFTSTKSVVHWFQIIRNKSFQMYDDDVQAPLKIGSGSKYYKVAKFPTRNIRTPIFLLFGGSDSLVDIGVMLKELPKHTIATEIPHFEHLDFLWGNDVDKLVFPRVFEALCLYSKPVDGLKPMPLTKFKGLLTPESMLPTYSEDERFGAGASSGDANGDECERISSHGKPLEDPVLTPTATRRIRFQDTPTPNNSPHSRPASASPTAQLSKSLRASQNSDSDGLGDSPTIPNPREGRRTPLASAIAIGAPGIGSTGISLGIGKIAGGVVSSGAEGLDQMPATISDSDTKWKGKPKR
ncbi:MAG: cholesterol esterase [Trizodia sp. TS-e1964]|nr:MAG: cholesterol esterase [Trizodia sp. TS-e1964]